MDNQHRYRISSSSMTLSDAPMPASLKQGAEVGTASYYTQDELIVVADILGRASEAHLNEFPNPEHVVKYICCPDTSYETFISVWKKIFNVSPPEVKNNLLFDMDTPVSKELLKRGHLPFDDYQLRYTVADMLKFVAQVARSNSQSASTTSKYTDQTLKKNPDYALNKRADKTLCDKLYPILANIPKQINPDEIQLCEAWQKKRIESAEGWNLFETNSPNMLAAMLTFRTRDTADRLILAIKKTPPLSAKLSFNEVTKQPVVLLFFDKAQLTTVNFDKFQQTIKKLTNDFRKNMGIYARQEQSDAEPVSQIKRPGR